MRFADSGEANQIVDWLNKTASNQFDPAILGYPTLRVFCSYNGSGPVSYLPFHRVFMLESVAANPEAPLRDTVQAVRDFTKGAGLLASAEGVKEIFFLDGGNGLGEMATHHGYELLPFKVYRMKL